jgi:hypothetical protein
VLEARAEGFFWTLLVFGCHTLFDFLHSCETAEQPKVTESKIQRVQWLGDDRNVFLSKELLHSKRCVAQCVS